VKELLEHIESLKKAFAELQPLSSENQQRLDKKFRLEWNYNSNHIEGNTLTYGETELLLIFEKGKGQHDVREFDEMRGHDVALKLIADLSLDKERGLTEKFIREINEVILVRPFYKEAITPDGQATRRLIKIGDYKSFPNSVRLQNGEIFNYPSPSETPALMHDFMNWYFSAAEDENVNPIMLAAELHYRFVCIHPFDDGNGRISRLLMNYHLLKNGYPPVIIKSSDKKNYLFALQEADTGNLEAFKKYIAEQLLWSYDISIKAATGESIDEAGDWEKKIKILNQKITTSSILEKKRSPEVISYTFNISIIYLIDLILNKWTVINEMFFDHYVQMKIDKFGSTGNLKDIQSFKDTFTSIGLDKDNLTDRAVINYHLEGFKKNGKDAFNLKIPIVISFEEYYYSIVVESSPTKKIDKFYHQNISKDDEEQIITIITDLIISTYEKKAI
jgi:Fic family protein